MAGGYVIVVGHQSPQQVFAAQPDKKGQPTGDKFEFSVRVGVHLLMNSCSVWGTRMMGGKDLDKEGKAIEHTTPGYGGEIKFSKWGDPKGCQIQLRYLKNSRSLDAEYQSNIQKIKIDEKTDPFIHLEAGQNKFDYNKQALLIDFLKVHAQNRDSLSKNPDPEIKGYTYYEETDDMVDNGAISRMESILDAGVIVKQLSSKPQSIRNLFDLMGKRPEFGATNNLSNDREIYKVLLKYSETNSSDFFSLLNAYKKELSDSFELAKSFNALDTTKNGHIALTINNKPVLVYTGIDAKGEDMIDYVMLNFADEEIYKHSKELIELVKKLK